MPDKKNFSKNATYCIPVVEASMMLASGFSVGLPQKKRLRVNLNKINTGDNPWCKA